MIELQSATKLYGTVIGVNDITLSLAPGAYGLLGPNGSGKTTLINLITGQLKPTLGKVRVFGRSPWRHDGLLRHIGLCPAVDVVYQNVSSFDWVCYLLELHGFSKRDAAPRAEQCLARVGLADAMHRRMSGYSLGMRQRAKLAQALAHEPDLLILDEPFNGLDPIARHEMSELLRQWTRDGRSLVLASHVLHEVEAITPSFLLICSGRLLASGSAEEVHSLLADVPNEIQIRCDRPHDLARRLIEEDSVEAVRFAEGGTALVLSTRRPLTVYERLPKWINDGGVQVHELRAADQSLQSLFEMLMRMHRGEMG